MDDILSVTKALADENRIRILLALQSGELCVCQVIGLLRLAPSTVSKHLYILRQARLIRSRKSGRWMHYRLPGIEAPPPVRAALRWVCQALKDNPRTIEDRQQLKRILKLEPEDLCARQMRRKCSG